MRVEGVEMAAGAYRLATDRDGRTLRALVPGHLLGGGPARPSHRAAHEALARQSRAIGEAIEDLGAGRRPRAPSDDMTFCGEPERCPPKS
jgi:hypothetical protein